MGDGAAKNEPARLNPGDLVDLGAGKRLDKLVNGAPNVVISRNMTPGLG